MINDYGIISTEIYMRNAFILKTVPLMRGDIVLLLSLLSLNNSVIDGMARITGNARAGDT